MKVPEIKGFELPSQENLSFDERVGIIIQTIEALTKDNFNKGLTGNPFRVKGKKPEEVLRFGMYKCYKYKIEKLQLNERIREEQERLKREREDRY